MDHNIRKKLVILSSGEQILMTDSPSGGINLSVKIDDDPVISEVEVDVTDDEFITLAVMSEKNDIDDDTIKSIMKPNESENKKGGKS